MKLALASVTLLLLECASPVLAQGAPAVAFAQVTGVPLPLHSVSGRFSSLNPVNQQGCRAKRVSAPPDPGERHVLRPAGTR
jgi:hypothetical protein